MSQRIEGDHVSFLIQVTRKQAMRRRDGYWWQVPAEEVIQEARTHTLSKYEVREQAIVVEWVVTRTIFDLCEL